MVSVVITSKTTNNKTETISVPYVNPEATKQQLVDLAENLLGFSYNSVKAINKVTKEELYNNG